MKKKLHPAYHENVPVTCACGEQWTTRSTKKELKLEVERIRSWDHRKLGMPAMDLAGTTAPFIDGAG